MLSNAVSNEKGERPYAYNFGGTNMEKFGDYIKITIMRRKFKNSKLFAKLESG